MAKDLKRYLTKEDIQITSKHKKRCSISYATRARQVKITVRYHRTPTRKFNIHTRTSLTQPLPTEVRGQREEARVSLRTLVNKRSRQLHLTRRELERIRHLDRCVRKQGAAHPRDEHCPAVKQIHKRHRRISK